MRHYVIRRFGPITVREGDPAPSDTTLTPSTPTTPAAAADEGALGGASTAAPTPAETVSQGEADVDRVVAERLKAREAELRAQLRAEAERAAQASMTSEERSELERLRADEAARAVKMAEEKGQYEKALASIRETAQKRIDEAAAKYDRLYSQYVDTRVTGQIVAAASARAIKPEQIAALLHGRVKLDPETYTVSVVDAAGEPSFKDGRPASIDELVEEFLSDNPHMAKPTGIPAAGASGSTGGGDIDTDDAALVEARKEAAEAHAKAESSGQRADIVNAHAKLRLVQQLEKRGKNAA